MERMPCEILTAIASSLPCVNSLSAFRLVCRKWAGAAYPVLARSVYILNTSKSLRDFADFLAEDPIASVHTDSLTVYHGTWPLYDRDTWEAHPLLFGGESKWVGARSQPDEVETAFAHYREFVSHESQRSFSSDLTKFTNILKALPSLTTLTVSHMQTWAWHPPAKRQYFALVKRIWLRPLYKYTIHDAVVQVLPALNHFPRLTRLTLTGDFQPYLPTHQLVHIRTLHLRSFQTSAAKSDGTISFLSAFPNLRDLTLDLKVDGSRTVFPLHAMDFRQLKSLRITNVYMYEVALHIFFRRHPRLEEFSCTGVTLTSGSWKGLYTELYHTRQHLRVYWMDRPWRREKWACRHGFFSCPRCPSFFMKYVDELDL